MKPWEKQERKVARRRGGTQQAGSGSGWRKPNDVLDDEYLWEMKSTDGKSISIKREDWEKVRRNALGSGRKPVMHLRLGPHHLVVLDEGDDRSPLAP